MKYIKSLRPCKTALYRQIWKTSNNINGEYGVDAAAAGFKNRTHLFRTKIYIGLDLNERLVKKGLKDYPDDIGIVCDLVNMRLPNNFADLVISSNTLYVISDINERLDAVKKISDLTSVSGTCIIEVPNDKNATKVKDLLLNEYNNVADYCFGNCLSMFFEKIIEAKNSSLKNWAKTKNATRLSTLLSYFENGSYSSSKTRHALFICSAKKKNCTRQNFILGNNFSKIDRNFFKEIYL